MAEFRSLIYNPAQGVPEVLSPSDTLLVGGVGGGIRHIGGALGFFNAPGVFSPARIDGGLIGALDQLILALNANGMIDDHRAANWSEGGYRLDDLLAVGPFVTGRLIVGSRGGWTALDLPAERPGVIQATARANGALAYVPITALSATAPVRPSIGSFWGDISNGPARIRLRVFDGNNWIDALPQELLQLRASLGTAIPGAMLVGDGGGWRQLAPGSNGQSLRIVNGAPAWADLIRIQPTPPWSNGQNRPASDGTIWLDSAPGATAVAFWSAISSTWHRAIADSPILEQLAALRGELRDGDLITAFGDRIKREPLGPEGFTLRSRDGTLAWEQGLRVSQARGGAPPAGGRSGDFWLAGTALHVHSGVGWQEIGASLWRANNGGGQVIAAGTPVVLEAGGWQIGNALAPGAADHGYGIALEAANPGSAITCAWGGIATLSETQWRSALDAPTAALVASGLPMHRELWLSSVTPGRLSTSADSGILVGRALSPTSLLLAGDSQSWARFANGAPAQSGIWWNQVLARDLPQVVLPGDLLAWDGSSFDVATRIGANGLTISLRTEERLADPGTGIERPNGTVGAVARPPTENGVLSGPSELVDGELQLGTNPQDPALFWRLEDGSTTRLSRGDLARTYNLSASDVTTDNTAAQIDLIDSNGVRTSVVLRGADGLEVTRTNAGTLVISGAALQHQLRVIDGGRFGPHGPPRPGAGAGAGIDAGDFSI